VAPGPPIHPQTQWCQPALVEQVVRCRDIVRDLSHVVVLVATVANLEEHEVGQRRPSAFDPAGEHGFPAEQQPREQLRIAAEARLKYHNWLDVVLE
jgi:hypothetical protein